MRLTRLLLAATAMLGLAAFAGPENTFTIDFPQGWTEPAVDAAGHQLESHSPDNPKVFCRANSTALPALANFTQEQINAQLGTAAFTPDMWAEVMAVPKEKLEFKDASFEMVDGHPVQMVTVTVAEDVMGAKLTMRYHAHALVGRFVNALCFAPPENFDANKDTFETVAKSLKPT